VTQAESTRLQVYVTRKIPGPDLDRARAFCDLTVGPDDTPPDRATLLAHIRDKDGVLTLLTDTIDAEVMDAAPNLRVISNMAVGYDNIDIPAASARGIPVGNTPGVLTETTADLAWALLMAAARRLPEGQRYVKSGLWETWMPDLLLGQDVYGATLGIVGFGRIGAAVARRARGFNMRVLYDQGDDATAAELGAEKVSFHALLSTSDFVSLHVPLDQDTRGLIGAAELALMKNDAVLVNTARGPVVDAKALYGALKTGQIGAAALDVTDPEPIRLDDPLLRLDNCLIVPHLGSSTVATRHRMAALAVDNLLAGLRQDRLPNCINPEVYT